MKSALVTGAYGFIGRHLCKNLAARGYMVTGLGNGQWSRSEWKSWGITEWRDASVDLDSLKNYGGTPDYVFHCAGGGSVGFSVAHPLQDFDRNVKTAASVLEYARQTGSVQRVVITSSAGVYGSSDRLPHKPLYSYDQLAPTSPYGWHKLMIEMLARSYHNNYGLKFSIVRLYSVYGPELRKQLLWDACVKFANGCGLFGGTGAETRDWIHVTDAARLLAVAAEQQVEDFAVLNGGTGIEVSTSQVLNQLKSVFPRSEGVTISFDGRNRSGDPLRYVANIDSSLSYGWAPAVQWEQGVAEYAAWFCRHGLANP